MGNYNTQLRRASGYKTAELCRLRNQLSGDPVQSVYRVIVNYSNHLFIRFYSQSGDRVCCICGSLFVPNTFSQVYCGKEKDKYGRSICSRKSGNLKRYYRENQNFEKYKYRREYKRLQSKARRDRLKAEGLCSRCGNQEPSPGYIVCEFCRKEINLTRK